METFPRYTVLYLLLQELLIFSHGEIFTSMIDLQELHETERVVIEMMENYLKAREENIDLLTSYLNDYKRHHRTASEDVEKYISNPINAFTLVKRLTADLNRVESLMALDISKDYLTNLTALKNTTTFPNDEDLSGAAEAIIRLQKTYRLNTEDLAQGKLLGVENYTPLSASDCFELGIQAYDQKQYLYSTFWLLETLKTVTTEQDKLDVDTVDVLQYLILAHHRLGNLSLALKIFLEWASYNPDQHIVDPKRRNDKDYEEELNETMAEFRKILLSEKYSLFCRGQVNTPMEITSYLHCRFDDRGSLFLRLAPFKVEEVHRDPDIVMVHDVISDQEIETIKRLTQPTLERSMVGIPKENRVSNIRISKTAALAYQAHNHVAKLINRLQDFTQLEVNEAEKLQVSHYGIGGFYEGHYDYLTTSGKIHYNDRIATVLLYLNDVEQGGATVLPKLETVVWPKKAAAVFWYNLHPSGAVDSNTLHGACPVLLGSKWVSNFWIHEVGQEFHRPCIPDRSSEDTMGT